MGDFTTPYNIPRYFDSDLIAGSASNLRTKLNDIANATNQGLSEVAGVAADGDLQVFADAAAYTDQMADIGIQSAKDYADARDEAYRVGAEAGDATVFANAKAYADQKDAEILLAAIADATAKRWDRGVNTADLNTLQSSGRWTQNATTTANLPAALPGAIRVDWGSTTGTQEYVTREATPRVFRRNYAASTWGAWSEPVALAKLYSDSIRWVRRKLVAGDDLNLLRNSADHGLYDVGATTVANLPTAAFGHLEVFFNGADGRTVQIFTRSSTGRVIQYARAYSAGVWGIWEDTSAAAKTYTDSVKWLRAPLVAGSDLNTLNTSAAQGHYQVHVTTVANMPGPWFGHLDVFFNGTDGRTVQIFTRSNSGPVQEYARAFSPVGGWGPWLNNKWLNSLLSSGIDFNSVRDPGVSGVQFTNHPNQPVQETGTLEVLPATGLVIQRFSTWASPIREFTRRATSATEWAEWDEPLARAIAAGGGGGGGGGTVIVPSFGTATRTNPVKVMATTETDKPASSIMVAMNKDRTKGYNCYTSVLRETSDEGATWTDLHSFPGMSMESTTVLDNGEIMVSVTGAPNQRWIYVSEGLPTLGAAATWEEKFAGSSQYVKFTSAWSINTYKNIVLVNEYGPKSGQTWGGSAEPIPTGQNARYTWLSTDHGKTWRTIFDLNAYTASKGLSGDVQHLHGVAWDPYWDRIWLTFGDSFGGLGSNGVLYSDSLGDDGTWEEAHYWKGSGPTTQVVGILPMPQCIMFLGDVTPSGLMRINRAEGKDPVGAYTYEVAFDSTAPGGHLGQAISRLDRPGDDGAAFFGFSSEGSVAPSILIATLDGYEFTTIYQDAVSQPSGFGIRNIAGPTLKGNLIVASSRNGVWSEIKGKAPGY